MARTFRGYHKYVHVLRRDNLLVVDVEPMGKSQRFTFSKVRRDVRLVHVSLALVRNKNHDNVSGFCSLRNRNHVEPRGFGFFCALAALVKAYDYVEAAVAKVKGMCVPLAAVADNRDFLTLKKIDVAVGLVIDFWHFNFLLALPAGKI